MSSMDPIDDGGGGGGSTSGTEQIGDTPTPTSSGPQQQQQHPPPSPLSGCYLLVVLPEPHTTQDKDLILNRLAKGKGTYHQNLHAIRQLFLYSTHTHTHVCIMQTILSRSWPINYCCCSIASKYFCF